jgi:hypothetical protein
MPDRPSKATKSRNPPETRNAADRPQLAPGTAKPPDAAFDLWLERGLHRLFDDIAQEPIPDALLKIIEQDRNKP